jgi:hypothetical protein
VNGASVLRRAGDRFSEVVRAWEGQVVVCIGGGPSLTQRQVDVASASGARLVAVNDAYRLAPSADMCYFADFEWWQWHKDRPEFKAFAGVKCSLQHAMPHVSDPDVHFLRASGDPRPTDHRVFDKIRESMSKAEDDLAAAGVRIINCSTSTAITSFPTMSIEEALEHMNSCGELIKV